MAGPERAETAVSGPLSGPRFSSDSPKHCRIPESKSSAESAGDGHFREYFQRGLATGFRLEPPTRWLMSRMACVTVARAVAAIAIFTVCSDPRRRLSLRNARPKTGPHWLRCTTLPPMDGLDDGWEQRQERQR